MANYENVVKHFDLYKSYGEFNFLFEDTIQEYRLLIIALIRISYKYFEEEDDEQRELSYTEQDRLLKIMMNNMGAYDLVDNCKACFIDFFNQQKQKHGRFAYEVYDEEKSISQHSFDFAIELFKKTHDLIYLRNIIIHSHYSESFSKYEISREDLKGRKDFKTGKGYEHRIYNFDTNFLEKINNQIVMLQYLLRKIRLLIIFPDFEEESHEEELAQLDSIDFNVKPTSKE